MPKIKLGDTVRDIHTGFKGVATARTEFLNGCIQYNVTPKVGKDNKCPEEIGIDEGSLEIVPKKRKKVEKKDIGGPTRKGMIQRGF